MNESRASAFGRRLGKFISTGITMFVGYAYCRWGVLWAAAILATELVGAFALYGAATFPYGKRAA